MRIAVLHATPSLPPSIYFTTTRTGDAKSLKNILHAREGNNIFVHGSGSGDHQTKSGHSLSPLKWRQHHQVPNSVLTRQGLLKQPVC